MRIVFFGTPQFAVPSLKALLAQPEFEVVAIVTQPDKRRGRGSKATPSPVKAIALEQHIPVLQPARLRKAAAALAQLEAIQADLFIVVAYGQILSKQVLEMPRLGCINVHGSLLPEYRGAAPIQWSIYDGKTETGITTMLMDEGMDTGAMLLKAASPIEPLVNAHTLATTLAAQGAELLVETLQQIKGIGIVPTPQTEAQATYARLIQKSDYRLDWSRSALELHNQVRGFYPSCFSSLRDQICKLSETLPLSLDLPWLLTDSFLPLVENWRSALETPQGNIGEIIGIQKGEGPLVQTGHGLLLIRQIQPPGKKSLSGWDFVNGLRVQVGEQFQ